MTATASRTTLLLFTRYPVPGRVKTRLIPALGPEGAASLHDRLVHHTLNAVRQWIHAGPHRSGIVYLDSATGAAAGNWLPNIPCEPQCGGDLGERLLDGIRAGFSAGVAKVIVIGSDCPRATAADFSEAEAALADHELVLGPANDGGYWLIGMNRPHLTLFDNIPWGGPAVLSATMERAAAAFLPVKLLRSLPDVDHPEDLADAHIALGDPAPLSLSPPFANPSP